MKIRLSIASFTGCQIHDHVKLAQFTGNSLCSPIKKVINIKSILPVVLTSEFFLVSWILFRLLPYHVVADYEAEEDDKILDSDTTGQMLSRSQQWDHNIAAKVAEFTATFEKQVLAFNIISRKRDLGEFRTEEKLMIEQLLLQEERRALLELKTEMDARQKMGREIHDPNLQMAALVHAEQARAESQARAEIMNRAPIRASALGPRGSNIQMGNDVGEHGQEVSPDEMINGWGNNGHKDEKEPSEDFLNDEETDNGDMGTQSEWRGGGELDLNTR